MNGTCCPPVNTSRSLSVTQRLTLLCHLLFVCLCLSRVQVEVVTPEDHMGDVIGDLNSRRGLVQEFTDKPGGMKVCGRGGRAGGRTAAWLAGCM